MEKLPMEKLQLLMDVSDHEFNLWDPELMAKFLNDMNDKHGHNIPIDMEDIKTKLEKANTPDRKMISDMYTKLVAENRLPAEQEDNVAVGEPPVLFKKTLTATDMCAHQHRLLIPSRSLLIENFFTDKEVMDMWNGVDVEAKMTDTRDVEHDVCFRIQNRKDETKAVSYVIPKPWSTIVDKNELKTGMEVQMTAWRNDTGSICLKLAKL